VFGFPCIVKPNRGAGSKGITKVETRQEIKEAVSLAFKQDHQVLIEPHISDGVEVTCTVHDITLDELLQLLRSELKGKFSMQRILPNLKL
jgi:D-alanine-D-alanine ligase-like ATP-grasp enzyme